LSGSCVGSCKSISKIPLLLPALAVLSGNQVTVPILCTESCSGTGTLSLMAAGKASAGKRATARATKTPGLLARFSFHAKAKGTDNVRITLSSKARAALGHKYPVTVELFVKVTVGRSHQSYTTTMDIARGKAPTQHAPRG
jgi:hypothetical protein